MLILVSCLKTCSLVRFDHDSWKVRVLVLLKAGLKVKLTQNDPPVD
jgi:hypothetical protein